MYGFPNQRVLSAFILIILLVPLIQISKAQSRRPSTVLGPVTLGGTIGVRTESYRANGINDRRPAGSGRIFGNTTASWGNMRYNLDFLLSTEDDRIRQSQNRIALKATHDTWSGTLGFFSPSFNKYGIHGATLRGGNVRYSPGVFQADFLIGQSQRAIDSPIGAVIRRPTFRRNVVGARVGLGKKDANHFYVSGLMARDKTSSLDPSSTATPAENVLVTPQFGLFFLDNRLALEGELTASAFSGDTRSARTSGDMTPSFLGLFTPRVGSRFDYASSFSARYTHVDFSESASNVLDRIQLLTSYERVDPGFVSLGRPYTRSDQSIFTLHPQFSMLEKRLRFGVEVTTRRNNLDQTRNATLKRNQIRFTSQAQLTSDLYLHTGYLWLVNKNEPVTDDPGLLLLQQRFVTQSFTLSPVLTRQIRGLTHRFTLTLALQSLKDKRSPRDEDVPTSINFNNSNFSFSHAVILSSGLALNTSLTAIQSNSAFTDVKATGFQTGANYSFFERKLSIGLLGGISRTTLDIQPFSLEEDEIVEQEQSTQWTFTLNSTYRFTSRDIVRLMVRGLTTNQPVSGNFRELQTMLRIEHRF